MAFNRRRESIARLEALGHLSDYYSDVASVSGMSDNGEIDIDDQSQWDVDSDTSTVAVVYHKPPPPGLQTKRRRASEGMIPDLTSRASGTLGSGQGHIMPNEPSTNEPHIHAEQGQPQTINTSHLRPAKGLTRPRHPTILRPGAYVQPYAVSEYGDDDSPTTPDLPENLCSGFNALHNAWGAYSGESAAQPRHLETPPTIPSRAMREVSDKELLRAPRHPTILCPGAKTTSDYDNKSTSNRMDYGSHKPQTPSYAQPMLRNSNASRPTSVYSAYQPSASKPNQGQNDHTVRASTSLYGTPNADYGDDPSDVDDTRSNYSTTTYSRAPRPISRTSRSSVQSTRVGELSEMSNQRNSQVQAYPPPSAATRRVDGIDYDMVSLARTRTPAAAPLPTDFHGRGRQTSTSSTHSRSRSPSPAFGAWKTDKPRQKRASFIDRTQERIERSINEHLMKAGRRPPPSFKVRSVEKSPTEDVAMWRNQSSALPSPMPWPESSEASTVQVARQTRFSNSSRDSVIPAYESQRTQKRGKWAQMFELSSDSEAEDLFFTKPYQARWGQAAATPVAQENSPGRPVNSNTMAVPTPSHIPVGIAELETPANYDYDSAVELEAPLGPAHLKYCASPVGYEEDSGADETSTTPSRHDSLFLGRGEEAALRSPADYSFFSSEYAQRRAAAEMERKQNRGSNQRQLQIQPQPLVRSQATQLPRAQSAANLCEEERELPRTRSAVAFSREQLELAALPSPLEGLRQPVIDHRRGLPSQTAARTVTRKKGMHLR
ncbi:hypothetical protein F5Y19DRAFT_381460 [Xylariaceae sp. FL1651]|nr:hypothetical protein F5Y19DRAFT_381460 [Xylariaceae sp. FL1651]